MTAKKPGARHFNNTLAKKGASEGLGNYWTSPEMTEMRRTDPLAAALAKAGVPKTVGKSKSEGLPVRVEITTEIPLKSSADF